jgi:hypothetical protein
MVWGLFTAETLRKQKARAKPESAEVAEAAEAKSPPIDSVSVA